MYPFVTTELFGMSAEVVNWLITGLIALVAIVFITTLFRMITRPRMASGRRSRQARLAITDAASIDDSRKLVLVRRDDVEHLVMIGGNNDMVIEADIRRSAQKPNVPTPRVAAAAQSARTTTTADAKQKAPTDNTPPQPSAPEPQARPTMPAPAANTTTQSPAPVAASPAPPVSSTTTGSSPVAPVSAPSGTASAPLVKPDANRAKSNIGDDMDALLAEMKVDK